MPHDPPTILAAARARRAAIVSLMTFRLDPSLRTFIAVSAAALETFRDVQMETIVDPETIDAALSALEASAPESDAKPLDARFALIFSSGRTDRRLLVRVSGTSAARMARGSTPRVELPGRR